jgi:hypothetical protein
MTLSVSFFVLICGNYPMILKKDKLRSNLVVFYLFLKSVR